MPSHSLRRRNHSSFRSVIAVILGAALVGCSTGSNGSPSPSPSAPVASSEAPESAAATSQPVVFDGPIRIIVNQAAGGGADIAARLLEEPLEAHFGVDVQVENITESGGVAGTNEVFTAEPDGHTVGFLLLPRTIQQEVLLQTDYRTAEFSAIASLRRGLFSLVVAADSPIEDFAAFVEASATQPLTVGTTGAGSATDLQAALLADVAGANITRVPFDGAAPARTAVLGGHIDASIDDAITAATREDFRILVVPTVDRMEAIPEIPSMGDYGFEAADVSFYQVVFGPPGMREEVRQAWQDAIEAVLSEPATIEAYEAADFEIHYLDGAGLVDLIQSQHAIVEEYRDLLGG